MVYKNNNFRIEELVSIQILLLSTLTVTLMLIFIEANTKNQPQIIVVASDDCSSNSSDSYELSVKKPDEYPDLMMVKYKSAKNNRSRLGSEDIALISGQNTRNDTRAPNNGNSNHLISKNNEESNVSNSVACFGAPSFEKYEFI